MFWSGKKTAEFIEGEKKIGPNGCDLRISEICKIPDDAIIFLHEKKRGYQVNGEFREQQDVKKPLSPNKDGFYELTRGAYEVRLANKINIPKNAVGLALPRSTFNRLGIIKAESALWDSGYSGTGTSTVFVAAKKALIHRDEYWCQFVMMDAEEGDNQYSGFYQNEERHRGKSLQSAMERR